MILQDDSVSAIISHATEERLKNLIEQIKSTAQHRANLSIQVLYFNYILNNLVIVFNRDK
jgi:hypothetical protein